MNTGIKNIFEKRCAVFGCGNILMGDDGFGPAVIDYLQANGHGAGLDLSLGSLKRSKILKEGETCDEACIVFDKDIHMKCSIPDDVTCMDVGTSIRDILFDIMLSEKRPKQIIIIDAADNPGKSTGELYEIDVDKIAPAKANDFSLHQFPTTNMLKELKDDTGVDVRVFVVQTSGIPDAVSPGLSIPVEKAVPTMAGLILKLINTEN